MSDLLELVTDGVIEADLAGLVWLLAERGVPLVVASADRQAAERVRNSFGAQVRAERPSLDALAGGVVAADSLEAVLRVMGAGGEVSDAARDLGIVLIVDSSRVRVAHYVRPVERDAAGHLQRRPPAVLAAWNDSTGEPDQFYWAVTDELATRAGMDRADFEDEHAARVARLGGGSTAGSSIAHRH